MLGFGGRCPLSEIRLERLQRALLDAFLTRSDLVALTRLALDKSLDEITLATNLALRALDLLVWARDHGRLDALLTTARATTRAGRGGRSDGRDGEDFGEVERAIAPRRSRILHPIQCADVGKPAMVQGQCEVEGGVPVRLVEPFGVAGDGDPALNLDLAAGRVSRDDGRQGLSMSVGVRHD